MTWIKVWKYKLPGTFWRPPGWPVWNRLVTEAGRACQHHAWREGLWKSCPGVWPLGCNQCRNATYFWTRHDILGLMVLRSKYGGNTPKRMRNREAWRWGEQLSSSLPAGVTRQALARWFPYHSQQDDGICQQANLIQNNTPEAEFHCKINLVVGI